ncbi:hypothetical protein C2U70_16005 [Bradyrhizobium guangdongense]|uniref:hypothetical protein n=1 Tax=Bradyrhizobium guangdongense TaxID=1325090 RepID=UPI0011297BCB|nr:hypothetical protein [Bradyrhizobium guangdongense]TPQ34853.1 hypothetical protein C2U70_16005 [Bradyrhizobium guangdongense]
MTHRPPRVHVTIDRLVLRGFPPEQRDAITAGLTGELIAQLGNPATAQQLRASRSLASLRTAPVQLAAAATPQAIGAGAGRRLVRSIPS